MKVKTLLKTFHNVEYLLQSPSGYTLEEDFVSNEYFDGTSAFEDCKVVEISTIINHDKLYITIK